MAKTDFIDILNAIIKQRLFDFANLSELVEDFNIFTNQQIPQNLVTEFSRTGLTNTDFFTSDFLRQKGFVNLGEFIGNQIAQMTKDFKDGKN